MDFRTALSVELLELCRSHDLTLNQLSERADVPISTLKNILNGQSRNPGVLTLLALCDGLDAKLSDFLSAVEKLADQD
jgi:transcriptional regulator with XRE-family HTH domain